MPDLEKNIFEKIMEAPAGTLGKTVKTTENLAKNLMSEPPIHPVRNHFICITLMFYKV